MSEESMPVSWHFNIGVLDRGTRLARIGDKTVADERDLFADNDHCFLVVARQDRGS